MTQSDPIYGLIAMSFLFGLGVTLLAGWVWLYATEWLMAKFNVSDPLDKHYKNLFQQINQAHLNGWAWTYLFWYHLNLQFGMFNQIRQEEL